MLQKISFSLDAMSRISLFRNIWTTSKAGFVIPYAITLSLSYVIIVLRNHCNTP